MHCSKVDDADLGITVRSQQVAYLIAVLEGPVTLANPRYSSARYSDDLITLDLLPQGHYELKVDLMAGDHGEFSETFWFKVVAGEKPTVIRMNQQPKQQS